MKAAKIFFGLFLVLIPFYGLTAQWILESNGLGNTGVLSITSTGNSIFAGTLGSGVYISNDTGSTWLHTSMTTGNIWSMEVNGTDVFAATDNNMGVYKSVNNGGNWVQTLTNQTVWSLLVNGTFIFAGTENNGVFLSTNGGGSWSQTSLSTNSVHALASYGSNVFAGTFNNGVYLSTDNGTTWNQTSLGSPVIVNALATSGNYTFAGTQTSGVYSTTNNGVNWTQTPLNSQYVRSLTTYGRDIFAGVQAGGVFISNDYGLSWLPGNEGLGNSSVDVLYIYNNYIFAGTEDGAQNGFYRRLLAELIGIQQISEQVPSQFSLSQNYPNPFNPTTKIRFALPKNSFATLAVYDMLGRELETLVNEHLQAGTYEADWSAGKYSSGVYYYKLVIGDKSNNGGFTETKKMVLIK